MLTGLALLAATAACNHDPTVITLAQAHVPASVSRHGSVTVAVALDASGKVTAASVFQSSGDPAVDAAAVDAAKRSTYAPGATDCAPSGGTFGVQFQYGPSGAAAEPRDNCYRDATVVTGVAPDPSAIGRSGIWTEKSVAIEVVIGPDGKVLETHIAQSSGSRALDEAALAAARETTYKPKIVSVPVRSQAGSGKSGTDSGVICRPVVGKYLFRVTFRPN